MDNCRALWTDVFIAILQVLHNAAPTDWCRQQKYDKKLVTFKSRQAWCCNCKCFRISIHFIFTLTHFKATWQNCVPEKVLVSSKKLLSPWLFLVPRFWISNFGFPWICRFACFKKYDTRSFKFSFSFPPHVSSLHWPGTRLRTEGGGGGQKRGPADYRSARFARRFFFFALVTCEQDLCLEKAWEPRRFFFASPPTASLVPG